MRYSQYSLGRLFIGRLPHGKDLIDSIEKLCFQTSVQMAAFSVIGSVTGVTLGAYDQKQQVYVTFREDSPLEIVSCMGNISLKDGNPIVHAHIILSGETGKTIGGHLFSETLIFAGEIQLQELIGSPLNRVYDTSTGLLLWDISNPDTSPE